MRAARTQRFAWIVLLAAAVHGGGAPAMAAEATKEAVKPGSLKSAESVQATSDQMHQLEIVKVETHPFRVQKSAIGQIAFNEDVSTLVLTPFSGRVVRLIAKVGDVVKRGDPLFEIDSPEVVQPQNDFIAAIAALNKARAQLNLAQIVEKRQRGLYEGKAAPLKEWQQAEASSRRRAERHARGRDGARRGAQPAAHSSACTDDADRRAAGEGVRSAARRRSMRRSTARSSPARSGPANTCAATPATRSIRDRRSLDHVAEGATCPKTTSRLSGSARRSRSRSRRCRTACSRRASRRSARRPTRSTRRVVVRSEIPNPDGVLKSEMFASFKIATGADRVARRRSRSRPSIREGDAASVWVEQEPLLFKRRKVRIGLEQDGPRADSRRAHGRRAGGRRAARSSSTTSGGNDRADSRSGPCCVA